MADLILKSAVETFTIAFPYTGIGILPSGVTLASGQAFASQTSWRTTTLTASSLAGASTIDLAVDVGEGAWLDIGTGATRERTRVSDMTGLTATLSPPLTYAHASGETVRYEPGVNGQLLNTTTATIDEAEARILIKGGVYRTRYRLTMRVTLSNSDVLEDSAIVFITE